jgi:anti-sigma regulatory factor (Ser/Thr protein kinase)
MSDEKRIEIKVVVPADLGFLRPLHSFLIGVLSHSCPNLATKCADEIALISHEAFTNICTHAYADRSGDVSISLIFENDGLLMLFEDEGSVFIESDWREPNLDALCDSGRGIWLMKQLSDKFDYKTFPGGKNVLTLAKTLKFQNS